MNWVIFSVLTGLVIFNLLGVGIYHYKYKQEVHKYKWNKDPEFWLWTVWLLFFGVCYDVLALLSLIVPNKIKL